MIRLFELNTVYLK